MGADHNSLQPGNFPGPQDGGRNLCPLSEIASADRLNPAYQLGVIDLPQLHNQILVEVFDRKEPSTPATIFDAVSRNFSADALLELTRALNHLESEGLLQAKDVFVEASFGVAHRREIIYTLTDKAEMHLFGLLLWAGEPGVQELKPVSHDQGDIISSAFADGSSAPGPGPSAVGKGGEGLTPTLPSPLPILESKIAAEENRVSRVMNALPESCTCGRPATRNCACGKETCSAHWYDADGNHTFDAVNGMCSEFVDAVREQTWGESRHGIAGRL